MLNNPSTDEPKPRRRWNQFRLRTLLIVVAVLGIPLAYIAHTVYAPPAHNGSYVVFQVREAPPSIWPAASEKLDREEFEVYKHHVAALVKAPWVINKALDDKTVHNLPLVKQHSDDAVTWLTDQIVVNSPPGGELIEIGMIDGDQQQASAIVNAVANAYMHEAVEKERTDKLIQRDQLDKKFRAYKSNVLEKQRQLFELEQMDTAPAAVAKLQRQIADLEHLAREAGSAEMQAELQIARNKHKLEGMDSSSPEYKAIKSEIGLAEVDRKFWSGKSATLSEQIDGVAGQIASNKKFSGDADQLRIEIAQLQKVINEMGDALTKWNVELDSESRIIIRDTAGPGIPGH